MRFKQLKSFTILEALISLMLMGIIISITYTLFSMLGKQMVLFEKENASELQYNLFNTTILNDINNASNFSLIENKLVLKYYNDTSIDYRVENTSVLRNNMITTDTFKLGVVSYEFVQHDIIKPLDKTFRLTLKLLNDTINTNYFLTKNHADVINNIYFNED